MQNDLCFNCGKQGHWVRSCPSISPRKSPPPAAGNSRDYPEIQCRCGKGPCVVKVSNSVKNPGRKYYSCPVQGAEGCRFFIKWVDEVKDAGQKPYEVKDTGQKPYPKCSCGAGTCKKENKFSGPNVGRSYFVCPIKKGLGACPFFQWEDTQADAKVNEHRDESKGYSASLSAGDSPQSDNLSVEHPGRLEFGLPKVDNANFFSNSTVSPMLSAQDDVLLTESHESGKNSDSLSANQHDPSPFVAPEHENSVLDSAKGNLVVQEAESWDSMVGKAAVVRLMSRSVIHCYQTEFFREISFAAATNGDIVYQSLALHILGWLGRLAFPPSRCLTDRPPAPFFCVIFPSFNPIFVPQDEATLFPGVSNTEDDKVSPSTPGQDLQVWNGDLQKSSALKRSSTTMDENVRSTMKRFLQDTALCFNQILMNQNSTDQSDPDSIIRGVSELFSVCESIASNPVTKSLKEYVDSNLRFGAIERSVCNEHSMEELLDSYNEEKDRFDDISKVYEKAVADLEASIERGQSLQEEASRLRDKLSQIENQVSCCQAETSEHKIRVDFISRDKLESKKSMEKAEEALELCKQKEEELLAAKAALEKIYQCSSQEVCGLHPRKRRRLLFSQ
ncbi:uncharacterized protein LOC18051354 isoform X1 [Citrus clementina]|uniref:uncharacterized protein LOC18051354 isoform X1 n=1 Tax=Citrus clementina TaxID=85681 RepID=UPI000CED0AC0|nr:uncharacterized protein LOC18051354 isoform X1 [Citrus x clementina]